MVNNTRTINRRSYNQNMINNIHAFNYDLDLDHLTIYYQRITYLVVMLKLI